MTRATVITSTVLVLFACAPQHPAPTASTPESEQILISTTFAPTPKDASISLYFPTRVGTKLEYQKSWGEGYVETVTAVDEKDGKYLVTVATTSLDDPDGVEPGIANYLVSREGVFSTASAVESKTDRIDYDPPHCLLKLPYKEAEKWRYPKSYCERATGKIETVKVPAGTFETIRVDMICDPEKTTGGQYSYWYALGVGAVKMKVNKLVIEMKSITHPKN